MAKERYAVYFPELSKDCPEESGYLWVEELGSGVEGHVDLVLSVTDGQLYARKKTVPRRAASSDYHSSEVYFHREHPLIPKLISHAYCKVLRDEHEQAEEVKATVTISEYCNGGDLGRFNDEFAHGHRPWDDLTESVLWHLFAAQLEVVIFLHSCTPSLTSLDNHMRNVFLHFPSKSSKFPKFFSGDLGQLQTICPDIWEPNKPGHGRCLKDLESLRKVPRYTVYLDYLASDLSTIGDNLNTLSHSYTADPRYTALVKGDRVWSEQFFQCEALLSDIVSNVWNCCDWEREGTQDDSGHRGLPRRDPQWYNKVHDLQKRVRRYASLTRANDPARIDFDWARNDSSKPRLWANRDELLSECVGIQMPGPFRTTQVDPTSSTILFLEDVEFGVHNPRQLPGNPYTFYAGAWSRGDLVPDPLRDLEMDCGHEPRSSDDDKILDVQARRIRQSFGIMDSEGLVQKAVKLKEKRERRQEKKREKPLWHRCRLHNRLHRITEECKGEE